MPRTRADILEAAATALLVPGVWTRGALARNASGHRVSFKSPDACKFCVIGAVSSIDKGTIGEGALGALAKN